MKLRQLFENIYDVNEGGEEFDNSLKTIGVCFGRWNPPHKGHKAVWQSAATNPIWYVGTNQSTSGPKDPVPYDIKLQLMQAVWPKVAGHVIPEQSLLTLAARIYAEHGQNVHLKVYTDEEWLYKALSQYNGVEKEHGMYNFQQIDWVKTERLASATNLRAAVRSGDRKSFYSDMGIKPSVTVEVNGQAHPVFDVVAHFLNKYPEKVKKEKAVAEIAGAFPTPSAQQAMYKAAAQSNAAEAKRQADLKAKADAERLQNNTAEVEKQQKINHHSLAPTNESFVDSYLEDRANYLAEGSSGGGVRKWANQVRKDHGTDIKFVNRKEGGGAVDMVRAINSQGETVGVYNRKTGYPTVFEPEQGVAEAEIDRPGMKDGRPYSDPYRRHPGNSSYMTPEYLIQKYKERLAQIASGPYKRPKEVAQLQSRIAKLEKQGIAEVAMRMQGSSQSEKDANARAKALEAEEIRKHQAIVQAYVKIMAAGQPLPPKMQQSYNTMPEFRKEVDAALANIPGQPGRVDLEQRKNYHLMPKFETMEARLAEMEAELHESSEAKISKRKQQSTAGLNTYGDSEKMSGDYTAYRLGMAVAGANGKDPIDMKAKSWIGKKKSAHPYTQEEQDMLKQAYKAVGASYDDLNHGDMKSRELDSTQKVSPVAAPKRNKYGV